MKKIFLYIILLISAGCYSFEPPKPTEPPCFNADRAPENCKFRGQTLDCVKVKFTDTANATFKVRQVEQGEDLTVRFYINSYSSNRCGQWRIVESESPDFTVALVDYGEDFTIRITDEQ
jgi:hypothetical protein